MNDKEQFIFDRIAGFSVQDVSMSHGTKKGGWVGVEIFVSLADGNTTVPFFFPDNARMTPAEQVEVIRHHLRMRTWNSVRP